MIVLFTDFGLEGPYTGQMKAVLYQEAAHVPVVDLFADAPAGRPKPSSYLLAAYSAWFPAGTIFLAVVDPGVGGARALLVLSIGERWFVGPDNGLFELVLRRAAAAQTWEITWRPEFLSASFHGRDLFAPIAARLARGEAPFELARRTAPGRRPDWPDDLAEIIYIDRYGNAITGLRAAHMPATASLVAGGRTLRHAGTFSDVSPGDAFWYENSNGLVEIAVNQGRADALLELAIGAPLSILS